MQRGIRKVDGRYVKQVHQTAAEVDRVLDENDAIRNANGGKVGGTGSDNFRWLCRIPTAQWGQWHHDWAQKGGLQGTGMKARDYAVIQASTPDYSKFVVTPSGKTGMEAQARRLAFGWGSDKYAIRKPARVNKPAVHFVKKGKDASL